MLLVVAGGWARAGAGWAHPRWRAPVLRRGHASHGAVLLWGSHPVLAKQVDYIKGGAQQAQRRLILHDEAQHTQRNACRIPARRRSWPPTLQEGQQARVV